MYSRKTFVFLWRLFIKNLSLIKVMTKDLVVSEDVIESKIHNIRERQVILDRDIAVFYGIDTRSLKQAVNRNLERFPEPFMFKLDEHEIQFMVSQNVIPTKKHLGGATPYVFTEQGVAMLSTVLRNQKAVKISVKIMNAFISMRNFLLKNKDVLNRLNTIEKKQIEYEIKTDKNFEKVFDALQLKEPKQGVFFEGQIFDAYLFVSKLIKKAKNEVILIDNYIDESILEIFTKANVKVNIFTRNALNLDIIKVQKQYSNIKINLFDKSHDRFLIIDDEIYHFGASLKDLGKKWFAFSKLEKGSLKIIEKIKN